MGLVGPRLVQPLHALYEPEVSARGERQPGDQQAKKKDARAAQNLRDRALAGRVPPLAMFGQTYRPSGLPGPLAPTLSPLVSAGHRAGILHYATEGYRGIARRLRSVNES